MRSIVDTLIEERASRLMARPLLWPILRPFIYRMLHYKAASKMADTVRTGTGREAFEHVSQLLKTQPQVTGLDHVPRKGPLIIIANHPTGLADGIYVYDALIARRADLQFMANADALRVIPKASDIIIPVEWVKTKRTLAKTKATLMTLRNSIADDRAIVIFPSGVPANKLGGALIDGPWMTTAAAIAHKYKVPIIPLTIEAENSALYYFFERHNRELKDITLFREMLNKAGAKPVLTFHPQIDPDSFGGTAEEMTSAIRAIVS